MARRVKWCSDPVDIPGVRFSDYESETAFQIYAVTYLRKLLKITGDRRYDRWHHSANERDGARAGLAARLMGQQKGMPDLVQFELRVALELKVGGNAASPEQGEMLRYFEGIGWRVAIVRSFEEFRTIVAGLIDDVNR